MIAKFTPFGDPNSGKTTMMRAVTYLLYSKADPNDYVVFNDKYYQNSSQLSMQSIMQNKSTDFKIVFTYSSNERQKRVAIATKGDTRDLVHYNWDFFTGREINRVPIQGFPKDKTWKKPDICISACHKTDGSRVQEEYEEHCYNRDDLIRYIYWFYMSKDDASSVNNIVTAIPNEDQTLTKMLNANVFKGNLTNTDKLKLLRIAQHIQNKIDLLIRKKISL